jgi:hypothetical protein
MQVYVEKGSVYERFERVLNMDLAKLQSAVK